MDRCRPRGNGRPAPPGPRPLGRAVGPHGSRGVLRVHPGTTRGAVEGRWGPGRPLAKERVLCVVTTRGPGRPAPVLRPGAPSEVAHLHESVRSEEHTSELQSHSDLVCRLLLEKKKITRN